MSGTSLLDKKEDMKMVDLLEWIGFFILVVLLAVVLYFTATLISAL